MKTTIIRIILTFVTLGVVSPVNSAVTKQLIQVINLWELYPPGIQSVQRNSKYNLIFGIPSEETLRRINELESQPVEGRIANIQVNLLTTGTPVGYQTAVDYGSRFIDVRVLRLLIRIAVNRRNPDEKEIASACDVVYFLKQKYPQVDFDYLLPQQVLDLYHMLGQQRLTFHGQRDIVLGDSNTGDARPVRINKTAWHKFVLTPRLNRLFNTGYESFV